MLKTLILALIKAYSFILSPFLGQNCRFHPTCSAYSYQAVEDHGIFKGLWLSLRRIGRCHPYYKGSAEDPVPPVSRQEP